MPKLPDSYRRMHRFGNSPSSLPRTLDPQ